MYRASIFDIPRKPTDLKSGNEGTANAHYRQVAPARDVTGRSFYQGAQQFRFENSGNEWFVPSQSFFRLRCTLTQTREENGPLRPIMAGADLAPTMGLAANLFKSAEVRLNGHTLERITERLPEIDALKTRMRNTGSWLDRVGQTTNFWNPDFNQRHEQVSVNGYLGTTPLTSFTRGPWLTQPQARFDVNHRMRYNRGTQIVTFEAPGVGQAPIDVSTGPMMLRPGDRLAHGALILEVVQVIDATHVLAKCVEATALQGNVNVDQKENEVDVGINGWTIQKLSSASNNQARGQSTFEIIWRPPLGFFDIEHAVPPGGRWVFEFNPGNDMEVQKNVVESIDRDYPCTIDSEGTHPLGTTHFEVQGLFFYAYTLESERFDSGDWFLDLQQTRCQLQNMPTNSMSLTQKTFDVPGKTSAVTVAFQDQGPTNDTRRSSTKFKIRPATPDADGRWVSQEGQDLRLERFFIQYGNETKPSPDFDGEYSKVLANSYEMGTNFLVQRYAASLLQADLYHTDGGAESYDDWLRRGPYFHFRWPKDAMENSTRLTVNFKFAEAFADGLEHNVMLFSHWRSAYKITHRDGRVEMPVAPVKEL